MNALLEALLSYGDSAVTWVILAFVLWLISGKLDKLTNKVDRMLDAYIEFHSNVRSFLNSVADKTGLKDEYFEFFRENRIPSNAVSNSPMRLSARGIGVADRLNAGKTAKDELPTLMELVGENPDEFEIQKICFEYAYGEFYKNSKGALRRKIQKEAFNDSGDLENVLLVYGRVFRDAVFDKLGIKIDD